MYLPQTSGLKGLPERPAQCRWGRMPVLKCLADYRSADYPSLSECPSVGLAECPSWLGPLDRSTEANRNP